MTSNAVQATAPPSIISIGRMPTLRPPASGAPSMTTAWPLPLSTTKETCSDHLTLAFIALPEIVDVAALLTAHR